MNQDPFLTGFVKQAQLKGITEAEALRLAKEAGIMGGIGDAIGGVGQFAWDMFGKPAVGMVGDTGRALGYAAHGQFGKALNAGGSALGNAALTGLNFIPGGALGRAGLGMGARLGARALNTGMGANLASRAVNGVARGVGNVASRVGNLATDINTAGVAGNLAGLGSNAGRLSNVADGAAKGMSNLASRAGNAATRFDDALTRPGGFPMPIKPNIPQPATWTGWGAQKAVQAAPAYAALRYEDQQARNPYGNLDDYYGTPPQ